MTVRILDWKEVGDRGVEVYASKLRQLLEPKYHGQFVAIDVDTEDYEVANEAHEASDRLRQRHPTAQVLVERIGYPAAFFARRAGALQ